MFVFGRKSKIHLGTADARLQALAHKVLAIKDHSVIKGHRGRREQDAAYEAGTSKLRWPQGKHNDLPSKAIDVQTYPRPESEQDLREEQLYLLGLYRGIGAEMGLVIRVGADWDRDGEIADNGFDDFYHVEIEDE